MEVKSPNGLGGEMFAEAPAVHPERSAVWHTEPTSPGLKVQADALGLRQPEFVFLHVLRVAFSLSSNFWPNPALTSTAHEGS